MNLRSQRDLFEIPEDIAYLNCAYMSPQLRQAREAGQRAVSRRSHQISSSRMRKRFGRCSRGSSAGMPKASRSFLPSATGSQSPRQTYLCEKERRY
jgi:hypothetical protein